MGISGWPSIIDNPGDDPGGASQPRIVLLPLGSVAGDIFGILVHHMSMYVRTYSTYIGTQTKM